MVDGILKTAGNVGKLTIRGIASVGTGLSIGGGGVIGTALVASKVANPVLGTAIQVVGTAGSQLAAFALGQVVDEVLCEELGLELD